MNLLQYLVSLEYIVSMVYTGNGLNLFFYPGLKYFSMYLKYLMSINASKEKQSLPKNMKFFFWKRNVFTLPEVTASDRLHHTSGDSKR